MNKYDFMQDMLLRARNRHRKELGLAPESSIISKQGKASNPVPATCSTTNGQSGAFDGKQNNPLPLGTNDNSQLKENDK